MDWNQLWKITSAADNVPIVIMLFLMPFYVWYAFKQAFANDRLIARLEADAELAKTHHRKTQDYHKGWDQSVHVWPYLLKIEFLAAIIVTLILVVWSICLDAPLEEPANPNLTMNPSKAPWYFLGLQELLVYFDPWLAGVVLPSFIVVGLCAIPYLDTNPKGNGYYTFEERPFAISFFWVGFLLFWVSFVILGTFLRGPNWSFFGPFEYWDLHKLEPMVNVDLSTYFWVGLLDKPRPDNALLREAPGIVLLVGYFLVLPPLLGKTVMKKMVTDLGMIRFNVFMHLFLWFALIPVKMGLRWTVNLKYFIGMPEYFFNV